MYSITNLTLSLYYYFVATTTPRPSPSSISRSGYVDSTGSGSSDVLDYSEQYLPQLEENPDYSQTIRFHLWTRSNASNSHLIHIGDSSSVSDSAFNSSKLTHVLIHGFRGNVEHPIIQLVKDAILRHCDSNVIGVDWGDIAVRESYADVVPHVKSVGNHVCQLLLYLKKQADLSGKKLHVIGHSLGAHVSGFAGKKCLEEAFRVVHITGLDPALPAFYTANSKQRLDSSDADFVDCIYGASGSYGYVTPICQANFYANGGSIQPYCLTTYERKKDEICSHEVVVQYYAESVDPRHVFDTRSCGNFNNSVDCPRVLMGYYADPTAPGVFVPKTKVVYPFARKILQKSFNTCGGVHHN